MLNAILNICVGSGAGLLWVPPAVLFLVPVWVLHKTFAEVALPVISPNSIHLLLPQHQPIKPVWKYWVLVNHLLLGRCMFTMGTGLSESLWSVVCFLFVWVFLWPKYSGLCKMLNLRVLLCLFLCSGMQSGFVFASRSQGFFPACFPCFLASQLKYSTEMTSPLCCERRFFWALEVLRLWAAALPDYPFCWAG